MVYPAVGGSAATADAPRWGIDVRSLAEDRGISYEEAAERLRWQAAAARLYDELKPVLSASFAGLWVAPHDGDRIKLAFTDGASEAARRNAEARLERAGIRAVTDYVAAGRSLDEMNRTRDAVAQELVAVNGGARYPVAVRSSESRNRTELLVPVEGELTSSQQAYVDAERTRSRVTLVYERTTAGARTCNASGDLHCDPPLRGGTAFTKTGMAGRCTVGFFARSRSDSAPYFLTAGHCFPDSGTSTATGYKANNSALVYGPRHNSYWGPNGDYAIVKINDASSGSNGWNPRPWVAVLDRADTNLDLQYYISSDSGSIDGQRVCFTGGATRNSDCGTVLDRDTQISPCRFDGVCRTVNHVASADFCAGTGDSGGPVFASHTAYGIFVAAPEGTPCLSYYQGIQGAENALNVNVVWGTS